MKYEPNPAEKTELMTRLMHALDGIRFGSVEIVIHNSKIVRIERHEKIRFEATEVSGSSVEGDG